MGVLTIAYFLCSPLISFAHRDGHGLHWAFRCCHGSSTACSPLLRLPDTMATHTGRGWRHGTATAWHQQSLYPCICSFSMRYKCRSVRMEWNSMRARPLRVIDPALCGVSLIVYVLVIIQRSRRVTDFL